MKALIIGFARLVGSAMKFSLESMLNSWLPRAEVSATPRRLARLVPDVIITFSGLIRIPPGLARGLIARYGS